MDTVTTIICSVLGSASLFTFIQFMINRHDDKNDRLQAIETQLKEIRNEIKSSNVDSVRTQMLLLISDYPDDVQEIMKCAEIYFKEMGGKLSFSIALLNDNKTGFILNSVHSSDGCYVYTKEIINGECAISLGEEEKKALMLALQDDSIIFE